MSKLYKQINPSLRKKVLFLADPRYIGKPVFVVHMQTTGLDPAKDHILQFGIIKCTLQENGMLHPERGICRYVKTEAPIPEHITKITGITKETLSDARPLSETMKDAAELMGPHPVVISYNATGFDVPFLKAAGYYTGWMVRPIMALDLRDLCVSSIPHMPGDKYSFSNIMQDLNIPYSRKRGDSKSDMQGYVRLWNTLLPAFWTGKEEGQIIGAGTMKGSRLFVRTTLGDISFGSDGYWREETSGVANRLDIDKIQKLLVEYPLVPHSRDFSRE